MDQYRRHRHLVVTRHETDDTQALIVDATRDHRARRTQLAHVRIIETQTERCEHSVVA
jgi:hypothetical protein